MFVTAAGSESGSLLCMRWFMVHVVLVGWDVPVGTPEHVVVRAWIGGGAGEEGKGKGCGGSWSRCALYSFGYALACFAQSC